MIYRGLLFVMLVWITASSLFAQEQQRKKSTIEMKWPGWRLNGDKVSYKVVRRELKSFEPSRLHLKKSDTNLGIAYSTFFAAATMIIIANNRDGYNTKIYNGLRGAAILYEGASIVFAIKSMKERKRAIDVYNGY